MTGRVWSVAMTFLLAMPLACGRDAPDGTTSGDLTSNLKLLNQWGEQPAAVQQLYAAAYKVLAAKPDASFADVGKDPCFASWRLRVSLPLWCT